MRIVLLTFVLVSFLLLRSNGFQVTSPKLVFGPDETGLGIDAPSGGSNDDYIISTCRSTYNRHTVTTTPLYKKKADGTYEMFLFPELQVCAYDQSYATTNGKWIFVAGYNQTEPSSFSSFYLLNNKSDLILATRYDEDPANLTYCYYASFIGESRLMTIVYATLDYTVKFVEWNYDGSGWNKTLVQEVSTIDFSNIVALTNPSFDPSTSIVAPYFYRGFHLFSKQKTDQWAVSAMFNQKDVESYEYPIYTASLFYNGNDTSIYFGGSSPKWSSGTIYVAEYQKNNTWQLVKKFNSEDVNLDNEYLNIGYSWVSSAVWINKDMAFLMAPNFPLKFNQTDWMYGGSVVMMYRDKSNQWQMGGRISLNGNDGSGEAVQLKYVTRTKNDVVITGVVINSNFPTKYLLYTYPLCFPNKMNFTCHQNVSVTSCSEADVTLPNDVRAIANYTDDKCGEPFATVSHVEIVGQTATADLKFERLGLEVGQCTATFFCPPPPPLPPVSPPSKVSGAVLMGFSVDIARLVVLITLSFVF